MEGSADRQSGSRGLSVAEHDLLPWLLTRGAEITGADTARGTAFLPQLGFLRVVGRCSCGCPTIDLSLEELSLAVDAVTETIADVEGRSPQGTQIGIILRAVGGRITELEAFPRDGRVPFSLPTAEQLVGFF